MGAALEIIIVPVILLSVIAVLLLKANLSVAGIVGTSVFLFLLFFVIIKLLRQMRRWDHTQAVSSRKALKLAEREGELAERRAREQVKREAEQTEREVGRPA